MVAAAVTLVTAAACHTRTRYQDTRRGESRTEAAPDGEPRKLPPSLDLDDQGRFRFVEPYLCPMHTVTDLAIFDVERTRPNTATLVIGVIAASLGVVGAASGFGADDPAGEPATYAGLAGLAVGIPLVVGPLVGNGTAQVPRETKALRTRAPEEPCGTKPLAARAATITWDGLRVRGAIDADGYFSVSPFEFVDAFEIGRIPALVLAIEVEVEHAGEPMPMEIVLDAAALAGARDGYLRAAGIDGAIETLRKVPRFEPGALRVSRVKRGDERGIRLALPIANVGPGDAYGVRLVVAAANPELDGRIIYVGRVPAKTRLEVEGIIPLSDAADRALAGEVDVAVLIRDAHDTAPQSPVRYRGTLLHDVTR